MSVKAIGIESTISKMNKQIKEEAKVKGKTFLEQVVDRLEANTPVDTGHARAGWQVTPEGNIRNVVPYMSALNEGHSKQAPPRFVEETLLSFPQIRPNGVIVNDIGD